MKETYKVWTRKDFDTTVEKDLRQKRGFYALEKNFTHQSTKDLVKKKKDLIHIGKRKDSTD